jgi:hypothetical protein
MGEKSLVPFLIASSVTAELLHSKKFSLEETVELAAGKADGTQLYVNPETFTSGKENTSRLKDMLAANGLDVNVVHIPGYAIPEDLSANSGHAMGIASELLTPVPGVGKLSIIHHDPFSGIPDQKIVEAASRTVEKLHDPHIAIGLEHFHPFKDTTQQNLAGQVDRYISLLQQMQEQVPTLAVFDIGRFWTTNNVNNPPAPLTDTDNALVEKMCKAVAGQSVLIHATDKQYMDRSFREPGNAVPIGTGVLTPIYKQMVLLGHKYDINWIGVVDETEAADAISDRKTVQEIFYNK